MKIDEGKRLAARMLSIIVIDVMGNYFDLSQVTLIQCLTKFVCNGFSRVMYGVYHANNPKTHESHMCVLLQKRPQRSCVIPFEMYPLPSC